MRIKECSLVIFIVVCYVLAVSSISFKVAPDVRKCLREEVHKDVLVVGEYTLSDLPGQRTDIVVNIIRLDRPLRCSLGSIIYFKLNLQVTDSRGHILFKKEDASKGRFAFTTEDYDMFEVCFLSGEALL